MNLSIFTLFYFFRYYIDDVVESDDHEIEILPHSNSDSDMVSMADLSFPQSQTPASTTTSLQEEISQLKSTILSLQQTTKSLEISLLKANAMVVELRKIKNPPQQTKITSFFGHNKQPPKKQQSPNVQFADDQKHQISSTTFQELLLNEGLNVFQSKWVEGDVYNFSCIACNTCFSNINDKRTQYNKGVLLTIQQLNDVKTFKKQRIEQHLQSALHVRSVNILKNKDKAQIPIIIKIESVLFLVNDSLSIPTLFEKLLYSLFRMKKSINSNVKDANTECLDVGETCNSWREGMKIFNLLQKITFDRLRYVLSQPMNRFSHHKLVWYSVSFDGWMKSYVIILAQHLYIIWFIFFCYFVVFLLFVYRFDGN